MEDPKDRRLPTISTAELERRWKAAREMMKEHKLDFLLMQGLDEFLVVYVRWFSDFAATNCYPFTVIFPVDDDMSLISVGGGNPDEARPPKWALHGVKDRLTAPYFPSAYYTSTYDAELAVGVLKKKKNATIGLVGRSFLALAFYEYLVKHLPGCKFVDATDWVDQIKAIKSPEEIEFIKRAAELQDRAMENAKKIIRPGRRDFEIMAETEYFCAMNGSERECVILVKSSPPGTPGKWSFRRFQNRMIKEGDQISLLIENAGPAGFYTHIGRVFSVGKPPQSLQDAFGVAFEAQKVTLDLLKPGADPKELWDANNEFLQSRGYIPETRLYAHGQGYDLVERPFLRYDEPMKIQAGMNICVHPSAATKEVWAIVCDNYMVTETGVSECLHKFPKEVIVL